MAAAPAAALAALLWLLPLARGHGMLTVPPARNWLAYVNDKWDWPDGSNAGGYKVVGQGGGVQWPNGKHGLCGDSVQGGGVQRFMAPGPIVANYSQGQVVAIDFMITTNHYGRIALSVCPADATRDDQCTRLQRADGRGDSWDLPAVAEGSRFNGGALGDNLRPMEYDPSYSWRKQQDVKCKWDPYCSRYTGYPVYTLKFQLPKSFTCDRCIMQWYYLTGHKCHPPCLQGDKYYPDCHANPKFRGTYLATMDFCGTQYAAYPEEFWNCADISIAAAA